jgi:hypothetical protein
MPPFAFACSCVSISSRKDGSREAFRTEAEETALDSGVAACAGRSVPYETFQYSEQTPSASRRAERSTVFRPSGVRRSSPSAGHPGFSTMLIVYAGTVTVNDDAPNPETVDWATPDDG